MKRENCRGVEQLLKEEAIEMAESEVWMDWDHEQIVKFQLYQRKLCMPFGKFHEAVERVLGRPVFTHEFAYQNVLIDEYEKKRSKPSFEDILNLISEDKQIIVVGGSA